MTFTKEQIERLSDLLMSPEEINAKVAFEILDNNEFPSILLSELFAFYKTTEDKELKKHSQRILEQHGSNELIEAMKMRFPLKRGKSMPATEKTIKKNIIQYTHNNELDGVKIAKALYKKMGVGATYLLTATPEQQRKEVLKTFINGTHFKLNDKALTKFPPELFEFPELTSIDLSNNKITSIPKNISVFTGLQKLNLSQNKLKSIHKNFKELDKLVELDLSKNDFFKKFPEIIFELPQLKKLNIIRLTSYGLYRELPSGIYNLKNLEQLELSEINSPVYSNYPSIKKVVGSPIQLDPLSIANTAYDQGDESPTYYLLKNGTRDKKIEILNKYYNASTETMTLNSVHIEELPDELAEFKIKTLLLRGCGLGTYYGNYSHTAEILDRITRRSISRTKILNKLTDLEALDLSDNRLCDIADLSQLKNLKELYLSQNRFPYFPKGLTNLPNLETLNMIYNYPSGVDVTPDSFPEEMRQLTSLKKFHIGISGMRDHKPYIMQKLQKLLPNCDIVM